MNITINPKKLTGKIKVIPSKSLSHRYLIAAGLAQERSTVNNILECDDLLATKNALVSLGVKFSTNTICGKERRLVNNTIDVKQSGSALRFIIPLAMLFKQKITFIGQGQLPYRPLKPYLEIFRQKGLFFEQLTDNYLPLTVKGKLKGGLYKVRGDVSSQFISGLLFALPLLRNDSVIELLTPLESKGYVELTLKVLKEFGIHILKIDQYFYIKGSQKYQAQTINIEADFSQASFWMVAGLIGEKIELEKLDSKSLQGDAEITSILRQMGGEVKYNSHIKTYLTIPSVTKGISINLSHIPDLGPILMVLAALSTGETIFTNASRLRLKESDRINAMYQVLTKFGVSINVSNDKITIEGQNNLLGNQSFDCFGDHRIAMAIAIAAIKADGPVTILNAEVVNKSYPTFFDDYKLLGGNIYES